MKQQTLTDAPKALMDYVVWCAMFLPKSADPPQVAKHLSALDILQNHVQIWIIL